MKKIIFSMLLFAACTLAVQAQSSGCAKTCTAKQAAACASKSTATAQVPQEHQAAAAKLASMDKTIEMRKSENGVTYVRKESCAHSGTVAYTSLSYDAANNAFVNVGPSEMSATTTSAAGCGPKATAASGKAGCSATAAGKGCCASKAKTSTASTTVNANEGKPVKTSGGTKN
jgi:hypothetical protein